MPCTLATPPPSPPIAAWSQLELSCDEPPSPQIPLPPLTHTLHQEASSVLSIAADEKYVYSGSQEMDIYVSSPAADETQRRLFAVGNQVWDRQTFQVASLLRGHTGSVLALEVSTERKWLFSSSGMFRVPSLPR